MDNVALAETTVDLYLQCLEAYRRRFNQEPKQEEHSLIFERAHHHYISNLIGQQKRGSPPRSQQPSARSYPPRQPPQSQPQQRAIMCDECNRQLTEKEVSYCKQNQMPFVCYHCSHG